MRNKIFQSAADMIHALKDNARRVFFDLTWKRCEQQKNSELDVVVF